MNINVTKNKVTITSIEQINSGEFNITTCNFNFSNTYNNLVKCAVFTHTKDKIPYELTIENNSCKIPIEVIKEGICEIGVYAYEVNGDDLVLRYSPTPTTFRIVKGSYANANQGTTDIPADEVQKIYDFIEDNYYTKTETDNKLEDKQDTIDSQNKLSSDLVDDTGKTHKFVNQDEKNQITTNKTDITTLKNIINNIYNLEDTLPTASVENITEATVQETMEKAPFKELNLKGNIFQQSYTGINMYNIEENLSTNITSKTDTTIICNFSSQYANGGEVIISIESGNKYSFIGNCTAGRFEMRCRKNGTAILSVNANNNEVVNIDNTNNSYDDVLIRLANSTTTGQIIFSNILFVKGEYTANTMPTYEPYTGNQPAPNPDYPQDVKVVTGDNNIKIINKNLYNENDLLNVTNWTKNDDGYYTGTVGQLYNYYRYSSLISNFKENTQYAIQLYGYVSVNNVNLRINIKYTDGTSENVAYLSTTESMVSAVTSINKTVSAIVFSYANGGTAYIKNIQIEENSTVTTHIPHQEQNYPISLGSIELCKIGDYQDYIYRNGDNWYEKELIGKTTDTSGSTSKTISDMIADSGFYSYYGGTLSNKTITYSSAIPNTNTIYYPKSTPTDTQITDTTLINQLNALYNNIKSYANETNIQSTCESGNIPFKITATLLKQIV